MFFPYTNIPYSQQVPSGVCHRRGNVLICSFNLRYRQNRRDHRSWHSPRLCESETECWAPRWSNRQVHFQSAAPVLGTGSRKLRLLHLGFRVALPRARTVDCLSMHVTNGCYLSNSWTDVDLGRKAVSRGPLARPSEGIPDYSKQVGWKPGKQFWDLNTML